MKLDLEDLDLLIYAIGARPYQYDEMALLTKLRGMRKCIKEETNELEANEN
jgi:hypothetical protein